MERRPATRQCARPGCSAAAVATLSFDYTTRRAWIDELGEPDPATHDLCARHADRLRVPQGWTRDDRRPGDEPLRLAV